MTNVGLAARRRRDGGAADHASIGPWCCAAGRAAASEASAGPRARDRAAAAPSVTALDGAALMAAVGEAEADGQVKRLPGLYLSLAQWRLDSGETVGSRGSVAQEHPRAATTAGLKDTHAKARLALGDIAHSNGDPATACEHWQIARSLFRELRQSQRARCGRGAHAAQRLPDGLGADRLLAARPSALTASGPRPAPPRRWRA